MNDPASAPRPSRTDEKAGLSLRHRLLIVFLLIFVGGATAGYGIIA